MSDSVVFSRGASANFANLVKDANTLYFLEDTHEVYLGEHRYAFGEGIVVSIVGQGDTVSNIAFDSATKVLTIVLSQAASAQSIQQLIQNTLSSCVQSVVSTSTAITVDNNDPTQIKLGLRLAGGEYAGNVSLHETGHGLRASVVIPDDIVQGVDEEDKILSLANKVVRSHLSINIIKENGVPYVVLLGKNNVEVSRVNASEFVKDGMLESAELKYSSDGLNHRVLVLTFNTDAGKSVIEIDVNDLVNIYTAKQDGGLLLENGQFSIANQVSPGTAPLDSDATPQFGDMLSIKSVEYDSHGLITGTSIKHITFPEISDNAVGDSSKILQRVAIDGHGQLTADAIDLASELSDDSTHSQVPTAKAVKDAIDDSVSVEWRSI